MKNQFQILIEKSTHQLFGEIDILEKDEKKYFRKTINAKSVNQMRKFVKNVSFRK